jgi:radical S-adenosyl methionine domain-containing protein 2
MKTQNDNNRAVLPQTINIHLIRSCNFGCRYCYAVFAETGASRIPPEHLLAILDQISAAPLPEGSAPRKVNFAGGEPFLFPRLPEFICHARRIGLVTSAVTNGSLLNVAVIAQLTGHLDILALSVDSLSPSVNAEIGRCGRGSPPGLDHYLSLAGMVRAAGIRLKVNTVVNRLNVHEDIGAGIARLAPFRWKLLQAKRIFGQNDAHFESLAVTDLEFSAYVERNRRSVGSGVVVVPETADDMTASYSMIAPNGCFFDNSPGFYRYSRPIVEVGLLEAFSEVEFSEDQFLKRGGLYA